MKITRDGWTLWWLAAAALVGYLASVGIPPHEWTYAQWLQFLATCAAWAIGKMQSSPAPSAQEVARGFRDNGAPV